MMRNVIVHNSEGNCVVEIPIELASKVAEIVESKDANSEKHRQICELLSLQRFYPCPSYKPYAIRATFIEVADSIRIVASYGRWNECYKCHKHIERRPLEDSCTNCGASEIANIKHIKKPSKKLSGSTSMFREKL